mgnify:FL=1
MRALAELATAYAYGTILLGMGLLTILGGTVFCLLRLSWWLFCLPGRALSARPRERF